MVPFHSFLGAWHLTEFEKLMAKADFLTCFIHDYMQYTLLRLTWPSLFRGQLVYRFCDDFRARVCAEFERSGFIC